MQIPLAVMPSVSAAKVEGYTVTFQCYLQEEAEIVAAGTRTIQEATRERWDATYA